MRIKEILLTAFYAGYSPVASGTAGTVVGMAIYFLEYLILGRMSWIANCVIVAIIIYPSIRLGDEGEKLFGTKDPPEIVLDEMMGYWISLLFYPFNLKVTVLAFFIFRIMDIVKPYPIKKLQKLQGGLGVMADDWVAGLYTNISLLIIVLASKVINMPIY